jgi:hypothetical protein
MAAPKKSFSYSQNIGSSPSCLLHFPYDSQRFSWLESWSCLLGEFVPNPTRFLFRFDAIIAFNVSLFADNNKGSKLPGLGQFEPLKGQNRAVKGED